MAPITRFTALPLCGVLVSAGCAPGQLSGPTDLGSDTAEPSPGNDGGARDAGPASDGDLPSDGGTPSDGGPLDSSPSTQYVGDWETGDKLQWDKICAGTSHDVERGGN